MKKPYNPNSTCVKCGHDIILSEHDDGILHMTTEDYLYASSKQIKETKNRYKIANEIAHLREHIKRTCTRCQYNWDESVIQLKEQP